MRILSGCLFLLLNLNFLVSNLYAQEEKTKFEYWMETGIDLEDVKLFQLNNRNCYVDAYEVYACLDIVLKLFEYVEGGGMLLPTKDVPEELKRYLSGETKEVEQAGKYFIAKVNYDYFKDLKTGKEVFDEERAMYNAVIAQWGMAVEEELIDAPCFEEFVDIAKANYIKDQEEEVGMAYFLMDSSLTWAFDDKSRITPSLYREQQSKSSDTRKFAGFGFNHVKKDTGEFMITYIYRGSPAEQYGLKVWDIIKEADGHIFTKETSRPEFRETIRGEEGVPADFVVERDGVDKAIKVTREVVRIKNVSSDYYEEDNVVQIRLKSFGRYNSAEEIGAELEEAEKKGVEKVILDLRGNGGGLLSEAVEIASIFLDKKAVVSKVYRLGGSKKPKTKIYKTGEIGCGVDAEGKTVGCKLYRSHAKLVILLDEGSASGSELLAQALADHKRATLVGVRTFGKGSVQHPSDFSSYAKRVDPRITVQNITLFTTEEVYTSPKGKINHFYGVTPHFEVDQKGYFAPIEIERIDTYALNPLVLRNTEPPKYEASSTLKKCVEKRGKADERFERKDFKGSIDYQLLKALDVVNCL